MLSELTGLIKHQAGLYQIKMDVSECVTLAEWVYDNYQYEQLETVYRCLKNPPVNNEKVWRLTPDVIRDWMLVYLDRLALEREKEIHNQKFKEEPDGEPDPRLEEWLKELDSKEAVRPITQQDINDEGQDKPRKPRYIPPDVEYVVMMELRMRYGRECCDLHTGKVKPGMLSFDEWIHLQK